MFDPPGYTGTRRVANLPCRRGAIFYSGRRPCACFFHEPPCHPVAPRLDRAAAERLVLHRLRTLWSRRLAGALLERGCRALLAVAGALLVVGVCRYFQGDAPFAARGGWACAGAALCAVMIYTLGSAPSLEDTAAWIDRRAGTHDRFDTALGFAARPELDAAGNARAGGMRAVHRAVSRCGDGRRCGCRARWRAWPCRWFRWRCWLARVAGHRATAARPRAGRRRGQARRCSGENRGPVAPRRCRTRLPIWTKSPRP